MDRCLVLHARRYDFKDADSGRRIEGITLTYLTGDVEDQLDQRGQVPLQIKAPVELWPALHTVPAVYAIDFRQRPGQRGRPTLQAVGVKFVESVDLGVSDAAS